MSKHDFSVHSWGTEHICNACSKYENVLSAKHENEERCARSAMHKSSFHHRNEESFMQSKYIHVLKIKSFETKALNVRIYVYFGCFFSINYVTVRTFLRCVFEGLTNIYELKLNMHIFSIEEK